MSASAPGCEHPERRNVGAPYKEDSRLHSQRDPQEQHRRFGTGNREIDDDAENRSSSARLSTGFVRSVEADFWPETFARRPCLLRGSGRQGLNAETVCAGVVVGRSNKLRSVKNNRISDPIQSLRYFAGCIKQAADGLFPVGFVDQRRRWLHRHTEESVAPKGMVEAERVLAPPAQNVAEVPASRKGFERAAGREFAASESKTR